MIDFLKKNKFIKKIYNFSIYFSKKKISGINNRIISTKNLFRKCSISVKGNNNFIDFGSDNYFINSKFTIYGNGNKIIIGKKIRMYNNTNIVIEGSNNKVIIDDECTFHGKILLASLEEDNTLKISEKCMFSGEIEIRTGDSHDILDKETGKKINFAKNIEIDKHVWIGSKVTILKGVKISEDSIVSANAVVTKEIKESNVIIGGIPAKIIKRGINWKM